MTTLGKYKTLIGDTPREPVPTNRDIPFVSVPGDPFLGTKRTQSVLKALRRDRGLTLELLSQLADVSPSYLSRLENGTRRLNTDIIDRLSAALGCDPSELLNICAPSPRVGQSMAPSGRMARGGGGSDVYGLRGDGQSEAPAFKRDFPVFTISTDLGAFPSAQARPSVVDFSTPADWVVRPHGFAGVQKAFGLYVVDEGYAPRYMSGETLYVHPSKALMHRCSVFVLLQTGQVFVRQFHGWSEKSLRLSHLNAHPSEENIVDIPKEDLKAVHKIVGCFEG